jgi:hypothetical protein
MERPVSVVVIMRVFFVTMSMPGPCRDLLVRRVVAPVMVAYFVTVMVAVMVAVI